jgi:hypothetical protein
VTPGEAVCVEEFPFDPETSDFKVGGKMLALTAPRRACTFCKADQR